MEFVKQKKHVIAYEFFLFYSILQAPGNSVL